MCIRDSDRTMPEEINRVLTDQISDILFTTSQEAKINLLKEGKSKDQIKFVGNTMIDSLVRFEKHFDSSEVLASCIGYSARKSTDDVKEEVTSNINTMNSFLSDMNGGISLLNDQLASSEAGTQSQFDEYFENLNNTTSTMEYLGIKVKTIFYKVVAIYTTLVYASYAMMQGLDGVINDKKLNKAIDTMMDPGKALKANKSLKKLKKFGKSIKNIKNIGK